MEQSTVIIVQTSFFSIIIILNTITLIFNYRQKRRLKQLLNHGTDVDGGHHKQWYLKEIAKELDIEITNDSDAGIEG